jgi:hypothetical protein
MMFVGPQKLFLAATVAKIVAGQPLNIQCSAATLLRWSDRRRGRG